MKTDRITQATYLLLRVVAGFLFFQAGASGLYGWFGKVPNGPPLTPEMQIGLTMEVIGGILMMLGVLTRPVAFILSGEMAVAYWQFHAPQGTWPFLNQGMPAVLFCFIFLFMAANGPGSWSLDALIASKRRNSEGLKFLRAARP